MRYLFVVACLALSGCCNSLKPGNGVRFSASGVVHVKVPSLRAESVGDALALSCGSMRLELAEGEHYLSEGEALDAIERRLVFVGTKGKTNLTVCEDLFFSFQKKATLDGVFLRRVRHTESRAWRGIKHFFGSIGRFFVALFTGGG